MNDFITMEQAKPSNMSNTNLARYLRDYGKIRKGEIRALTLAAADRIAELSARVRELENERIDRLMERVSADVITGIKEGET